jgi:hypothetical protein
MGLDGKWRRILFPLPRPNHNAAINECILPFYLPRKIVFELRECSSFSKDDWLKTIHETKAVWNFKFQHYFEVEL